MPRAQPECYPFGRATLPYTADEVSSLAGFRPTLAPAIARSRHDCCGAAWTIGRVAHAGTRRVQRRIAHRAERDRLTSRAQRSDLRGLRISLVSRKRKRGCPTGFERWDFQSGPRATLFLLRNRRTPSPQLLPSSPQRTLNTRSVVSQHSLRSSCTSSDQRSR
jgi:hypothetical protein